jgi:hypothetical protein
VTPSSTASSPSRPTRPRRRRRSSKRTTCGAVGLLIETGGILEIDGVRVRADIVGHVQENEADDLTLVKVVAALLA